MTTATSFNKNGWAELSCANREVVPSTCALQRLKKTSEVSYSIVLSGYPSQYTFNMKRVLSKSNHAIATDEARQYPYNDTDDTKARHILGLDVPSFRLARKNSLGAASANKARSVTFSNATTAAVTTTNSSHLGKENVSALSRKTSSPLLSRSKKSETQTGTIRSKLSSSSLRSFYDKNRAPLNVSQQTSESSSRDFALRKGAPSVVSTSIQGSEHSRQLRLVAMSHKDSSREQTKFTPSVTKFSNSSSKSLVPSLTETASDTAESLSSHPSRISIIRSAVPEDVRLSSSPNTQSRQSHPFTVTRTEVDPARAKINVRRPKAGTKNWFDSLDTDSSEDESTLKEPQLAHEFILDVSHASQQRAIDLVPSASSLCDQSGLKIEIPGKESMHRYSSLSKHQKTKAGTSSSLGQQSNWKRKVSAFENTDLTKQSILVLDSSDDEDEASLSRLAPETGIPEISESSVMNGPWDRTRVGASHMKPVSTADSEKVLQRLQKERFDTRLDKRPARRRASYRGITYLEDCSTETITQQDDLLTSFPQTPTDTQTRDSSVREYILSEEDSSNTKLITVTRQEESLIAAMRLKKTAMKRAQAMVHRQGISNTPEGSTSLRSVRSARHRHGSPERLHKGQSPPTQRRVRSAMPSVPHSQRTDSVTTFQTDSVHQQSIRSSIATYLSEGSEDLQLPYSTVDGLPMGSSRLTRSPSAQSDRPRRNRDTFLSETTASTSAYAGSTSEWSPSVRGSHPIELDPVQRGLLRESIPSQLFMERPFLGWDAQTSMQEAH